MMWRMRLASVSATHQKQQAEQNLLGLFGFE